MVCSKSVANFKFLRVTRIRFSIFCGVMLVLISFTYADKFARFECSVNFWQLFCLDVFRLVFDFCLFSFGNKKSHRGPDLGNTVAVTTSLRCFWSKIRAQAAMCEQGRYHGAKANFCSSTNPGVSGGLFRANCAQLARNIPYWPFHPEILTQILWSIFLEWAKIEDEQKYVQAK